MFDYKAGEKYRLTLGMTAAAGVMGGAFITMLMATSPEPPRHHAAKYYVQETAPRYGAPPQSVATATTASSAAAPPVTPPADNVDPKAAKQLIEQWLPLAWDLSAGTAAEDQDVAMKYMTSECAEAYRKTIWTPELAKQIDEAGLHSAFAINSISDPLVQNDGSAVINVEGVQTITAANGRSSQRQVKLEYSLVDTPDGPKISSFKENGENS